jgi:hypothetical protein
MMRRVPCAVSPTVNAGLSFTCNSQKNSSLGASCAKAVVMLNISKVIIFFIGLD